MASAPLTIDETVQIPIPTPCDLCDSVEEVNSFCRNCGQKLCDVCKRSHLRSTQSRDHTVVHVSEGPCLADEPMICQEHKKTLVFYCRTCSSLSCPKCLTKQHRGHDFVDTDEYAEEIRSKTQALITRTEKEKDEKKQKTEQIEKAKEEFLKEMDATEISVQQTTKDIVYHVKKIEAELLSELRQRKTMDVAVFDREINLTASEENELEASIQKLKMDSESQDNLALIRSVAIDRDQSGRKKKRNSPTLPAPLVHIRGGIQYEKDLRKIVGYLQSRETPAGHEENLFQTVGENRCRCKPRRRTLNEKFVNKCSDCGKPLL